MSIGVCGLIYFKEYDLKKIISLSYDLTRISADVGIGLKMGGNISEDVWSFYSSQRINNNTISFELMDSPLDNFAENLFQPTIMCAEENFENAFEFQLKTTFVKVLSILQTIQSNSLVASIDFCINYLFVEDEKPVGIALDEIFSYVLNSYKKRDYAAPILQFKIEG